MRLLNASTIELEEFTPNRIPPYAILSHTWGIQEVIFEDFQRGAVDSTTKKEPWGEMQDSCQRAMEDGLEYIWIDTCCINKSSSAELSECLNSIFAWYGKASICYAYLVNVPPAAGDPNQPGSAFEHSRWFTRGWTLQELLAPAEVLFFSQHWTEIGRKSIDEKEDALCRTLSRITRIDEDILKHRKPLEFESVARRMAWAAHRETTRPEDMAYSLMGIFSVHMPMLYGEGSERAFLRLQEEIMKQSDDQTIFAWVDCEVSETSLHGLLATSPSKFAGCHHILPYQDWAPRQPYSMTNRGLRIELPIIRREKDEYVAVLDCPSPPEYEDTSFLAFFLKRLSTVDGQYTRVKVDRLAEVHEQGPMQTIYVRQTVTLTNLGSIFWNHILQLRGMPGDPYRLVNVLAPIEIKCPVGLSSSRAGTSNHGFPQTFRIMKGVGNHLLCFAVFERTDGRALIVMLGSEEGFSVGFDVIDAQGPDRFDIEDSKTVRNIYQARKLGSWVTLEDHLVCVDAEPRVHNGTKYYMIDIKIHAVHEQSNPLNAVSDALQSPNMDIRPAIRPLKKPESKPLPDAPQTAKRKSAFGLRRMFGDNHRNTGSDRH